MRTTFLRAAAILTAGAAIGIGSANAAPTGEITVWSWNIAAEALDMLVPDFNKQYPGREGDRRQHGPRRRARQSSCRLRRRRHRPAGRGDIENDEAEVYWARFPDCFTNLKEFGVEKYKDAFPAFKWPQLSVGDAHLFAAVGFRPGRDVLSPRHLREGWRRSGLDIKTWDDFIAAGKKIDAATGAR